MSYNTGGPAFPMTTEYGPRLDTSSGMTLRDYFAAKAMQALLTHGYDSSEVDTDAVAAYEIADAMLKERSK